MDKAEKKELEGRYAAKMRHSADTYYEFTKGKYEKYDALGTGYSKEYEIMCELLEEFKTYNDPLHKRFLNGTELKKYPDFQLDFKKPEAMCKKAKEDGRIPLLRCFFWDYEVAWDLNKTDWRNAAWNRETTTSGIEYERGTEISLQAHLPLDGPQGPVYKVPMNNPEEFWQSVAAEIKKDYPDYSPSWLDKK